MQSTTWQVWYEEFLEFLMGTQLAETNVASHARQIYIFNWCLMIVGKLPVKRGANAFSIGCKCPTQPATVVRQAFQAQDTWNILSCVHPVVMGT